AMNHFGRLDILINNAGITRDKFLTRMAAADFTAVMTTNVFGAFNLTKAAMKVMQKARQGAIVNLSSISGLHGNIGQA
ncbi:SDR family NAD(P)-dependent oxidoreductase, partial [Mycobacterium kansasii]